MGYTANPSSRQAFAFLIVIHCKDKAKEVICNEKCSIIISQSSGASVFNGSERARALVSTLRRIVTSVQHRKIVL